MKIAACLALVGLLAMQRPANQAPPTPEIPILTAPDGAALVGKGGHGFAGARTRSYEFQLTLELSSAEMHYRLSTATTVPEIADHYLAQLTRIGWAVTSRQSSQKLAHARLSAAPNDAVIGTLTIVPMQSPDGALVSCRLVRAIAPWRDGSRGGGGGANAKQGLTLAFGQLTGPLKFPVEVAKAETRSSGGNRQYEYFEMRLLTPMAPVPLMAHLQAQLPKDGWAVDARIGDEVQELIVRRNPAADFVELWQITSLPVTRETDALVARIR